MVLGETNIGRATRWLKEEIKQNPAANRMKLVDEAGPKFNLGPTECDYLIRNFVQTGQGLSK